MLIGIRRVEVALRVDELPDALPDELPDVLRFMLLPLLPLPVLPVLLPLLLFNELPLGGQGVPVLPFALPVPLPLIADEEPEPVLPVVPIEPVDPVEPVVPIEPLPVEPVVPVDPMEPVDPVVPVPVVPVPVVPVPVVPVPVVPVDPVVPIEPIEPALPLLPAVPVLPLVPVLPVVPLLPLVPLMLPLPDVAPEPVPPVPRERRAAPDRWLPVVPLQHGSLFCAEREPDVCCAEASVGEAIAAAPSTIAVPVTRVAMFRNVIFPPYLLRLQIIRWRWAGDGVPDMLAT